MNCNTISTYLIDYIDGKLNISTHQDIEKHIETCSACANEYKQTKELFNSIENIHLKGPHKELKISFNEVLAAEKSALKNKNQDTKTFTLNNYKIIWQAAAAILLLVSGYLVGYNTNGPNSDSNQISEVTNEVKDMKHMLALSLLQNESASQRIKAVSYTEEIQKPDNETIEALINTLETDKSSNVRLAAVYSLSRFKTNSRVKEAFISALNKQDDAMVQIVIINMLVEMEEVKAVDELKELLNKKDLHEEVKSQAELGVKALT